MSEQKIHSIIKCVIFGVTIGLLCDAILLIIFTVSWELLKDYRGSLSETLGWTKGFFWLLPILFAYGLVLAAPIAFSIQGLFAARLKGKHRYREILIGPLRYVGLLAVMLLIYMFVSGGSGKHWITLPLLLLLPRSALSVFGFWLPSVATGLYCRLSRRPQWRLSGIIGILTLIAGVLFWTLMGVMVGAETD
jgi:hypothetical protein